MTVLRRNIPPSSTALISKSTEKFVSLNGKEEMAFGMLAGAVAAYTPPSADHAPTSLPQSDEAPELKSSLKRISALAETAHANNTRAIIFFIISPLVDFPPA